MVETGLLVGGEWRTSATPVTIADRFSGDPMATVHPAAAADVEDALAAASATAGHRPLPPAQRAEILIRAAGLLADREERVLRDYISETGFTVADAETELSRACETLRLAAEEGLRLTGETVPVEAAAGSENRLAFTLRVPVGVVVAIVPFNAPLNTLVHKVGPALAAGNAVLVKPAEATPLSAINVCAALLDAGLPPRYLSLLPGPGETVGEQLISDSRVRYITFTGSTAVGLRIKQRSGIAKTHLELGSNSATIVCADADVAAAAAAITRAGYRKAGQVCTSVQRVLVDAEVAGPLADALAAQVKSIAAGDPHQAGTALGPMIAEAEAARAAGWVSEAVGGGARVLAGGDRHGALMSATLLADLPPDARIMRDEIFAPVVALRPVSGFDEAVDIVNDGRYGLQAGVFTRDLKTAFAAAHRLRVGGVIVNDTSSYHADLMPYGGVKASGYGVEGPRYAVQDMTDPRIVVFNQVVPEW